MGIELNNDQIYALYDLENWWNRQDDQLFQITGGAGCGKAQPDNTKIPTPNGVKLLKDLKVGDYVFDMRGRPTKIIDIYPQGKKRVYEIRFSDERKTRCCEEHLWTWYKADGTKNTTTVRYFLRHPEIIQEALIPICNPVIYNTSEQDIPAYLAGKLLAECDERVTSEQVYISKKGSILSIVRYELPFDNSFNDDKIIDNRYIEDVYKYTTKRQRWSLLKGLFQKNSIWNKLDNDLWLGYTFSTSKILIDDIQEILYSLGISSYKRARLSVDGETPIFTLHLYCTTLEHGFFNYQQEFIEPPESMQKLKYHKITEIVDLGYETEMRCIYVDNKDHLYLTNDYIVTHNTFLVRYFIDRLELKLENVLFVAFMGKAASVLQRNGLPAKTIHSAIYDYKERMARDENNKIIITSKGKPKLENYFELKDHLSKKIKLIVVDEASMVDNRLGEDLMSFGIPVIALGDLNQLPPVFGKSYFLQNPNVTLKQIMRQAEGNPIIWLSQQVLAGKQLKCGVYGNSAIINKSDITDFHFRHADIIITGTNKLRYNINNYCRSEIKGIKKLEYPHTGEKVICRKNNWNQCINDNIYLTNGITGFVDFIHKDSYTKNTMKMDFRPDFLKQSFKNIEFDYNHMYAVPGSDDNKETPFGYLYDKMEYAYAITCHSSQGSQWKNVMYMHEDFMNDSEDRKKLIYTALTRASESVTMVL